MVAIYEGQVINIAKVLPSNEAEKLLFMERVIASGIDQKGQDLACAGWLAGYNACCNVLTDATRCGLIECAVVDENGERWTFKGH